MIDNLIQVTELVEEMNDTLPISVRPSPAVAERLQLDADHLPPLDEWAIEAAFYMGDEAGITCGLRSAENSKQKVVVSLTHLLVDTGHPLYRRIRDYQLRRTKKLMRLNGGQAPPKPKPNRKKRKPR